MYESFFGLKRRPFLFAPDVESYFSVDFMEESRRTVEHTVQKGEGISLIFGAAGTGKTLLMRLLQQSLEPEYTVALVSHSRLETAKALFLQLAHDLRISPAGTETVELRLQILDFARQEPTKGVVLLFDEAQHLSPSVLEEIRLLTDSTDGSVSLFRAVLAGTLDFEEKLTLPNLETFNQRVVSRCYLDSFSGEETCRYVVRQTDDLRIDPTHEKTIPLFTEAAKRRIHQLTDGNPRLINQLCDTALYFAAGKKKKIVDVTLVDNAWASLQHIESVSETESADSSAVQEPMISPEQIEEIIDRKRKTFQIRQFDPVEFGTLDDSGLESAESEPARTASPLHENEYKPPYPEDDDEFAELVSAAEDEVCPAYRPLQLHIPADAEETEAEPARQCVRAVTIPKRKLIPNYYRQELKFHRQYLLRKIQHRLGLFAGLFLQIEPVQSASPVNESDMNAKSLQDYGAAVLDGRPPFVRKEPHYAYQATDMPLRNDVTYPDPKTGVPITLRWLPEEPRETERFGVSYTEFLNRDLHQESSQANSHNSLAPDTRAAEWKPVSVPVEPAERLVVRTSLNASSGSQVIPAWCSGLEESFEESRQVDDSAISLAELFRTNAPVLQQFGESAEFRNLDEAVQRQLEAVVKRIIKAAEKIEQAAEVSERAGQHVSKAAEFVEAEVQSALPTYTDLFRQWSEFQNMISMELESARQQNTELPKFRTFPRRQVMIERTVSAIDVESLLR